MGTLYLNKRKRIPKRTFFAKIFFPSYHGDFDKIKTFFHLYKLVKRNKLCEMIIFTDTSLLIEINETGKLTKGAHNSQTAFLYAEC